MELALGMNMNDVNAGYGGGGSYLPQALALFARMTTPPTAARKAIINTTIKSLITAGIWAKLDALWFMAAADSQTAKLNWVANQFNLTEVSAPTFTTDRGFTGNGTTSYLDTGAAPTALTKWTQNSAHVGVTLTAVVQLGLVGRIAAGSPTLISPSFNTLQMRVNAAGGTTPSYTQAGTTTNEFVASRPDASTVKTFYNGVSQGDIAQASAALDSGTLMLLRAGTGFSTGQMCEASLGANLTVSEVAAFRAINLSYLTAVGAA